MIIMVMMTIYSGSGSESWQEWRATDLVPARSQKEAVLLNPHSNALCMLTYLTEPLHMKRNEEYGQNRNCPS